MYPNTSDVVRVSKYIQTPPYETKQESSEPSRRDDERQIGFNGPHVLQLREPLAAAFSWRLTASHLLYKLFGDLSSQSSCAKSVLYGMPRGHVKLSCQRTQKYSSFQAVLVHARYARRTAFNQLPMRAFVTVQQTKPHYKEH